MGSKSSGNRHEEDETINANEIAMAEESNQMVAAKHQVINYSAYTPEALLAELGVEVEIAELV